MRLRHSLVLGVSVFCPTACSSTSTDQPQAQQVTDPNCVDGGHYTAVPSGSCQTGASCDIHVSYSCKPGDKFIGGGQDFSCKCDSETWDCTMTYGSLTLIECDAGASDAAPE